MFKRILRAIWPILYVILMGGAFAVIVLPVRSCVGEPKRLSYKRDNRTGICYAYTWWNGIASVPCDKVKEHLEVEE